MRAQFVLVDGFDPLDVVAPFEVLTAGSQILGGGVGVERLFEYERRGTVWKDTGRGPRTAVTGERTGG